MKLLYIALLLSVLLYSPEKSNSQTFMGMEVDHVCLVIYEPSKFPTSPPIPLPPNHPDSLKYKKELKAFKKKYGARSISAITGKGEFNSTIIWKSKQCLDSIDLMELDSVLSEKKIYIPVYIKPSKPRNPSNPPLPPPPPAPPPSDCYHPHHSIFLYKNDNVIYHYDICFSCGRVENENREYLHGVDFRLLGDLYDRLGIPTSGEELETYIEENRRTE